MQGEELLAEVMLWLMYALLLVASGVTLWSVVHSLRKRSREQSPTRGVPARPVAYAAAGLLVGTMILSFLLASTRPLLINGEVFDDTFWLRVTDMFIWTLIVMLTVAVAGVLIGMSGLSRRGKGRKGARA